ncbi:wd-repeat protein, putative [Trichomonas vaginalis G3]|uniref:Wd-repeat protein, putative n=1 Tax=Trichomonas vaginalis (strain ATCC PRA-98 / G3) TaxID=412133 RepID=A2EZF3_TRIV3|nr:ubiquitin binding [Trichomonas vaginalis G3]EAY01974.1 wd-repeat protein, putative [Trichomonas vaginalis G3]KAI5523020.1 ubiquitin binding [Trichomonas vaginalis G3]|eukprot:XP_001330815.1 wd-repeat protein [Trichomonas vaginalis G3]
MSKSGAKLQATHIVELHCENMPYTVYETRWIPNSKRIAICGSRPRGTGVIQVYKMQSQKEPFLMKLLDIETENAIRCATFAATDPITRNIAVGDLEGNVMTFDFNEGKKNSVFKYKVHEKIINCIDGGAAPGPSELVTGSRDGNVCIVDIRAQDPAVATLKPEGTIRDCWAVSMGGTTGPSDRSVIAGYDNGDLKLWDLRANQVSWETNLRNGVASVQFSDRYSQLSRVTAGCLTGQLVTFDLTDKPTDKGYRSNVVKIDDSATVWIVQHCPQKRDFIATTGGSGKLLVWKKSKKDIKYENVSSSQLSTQPINSFDWHPDKEGLAVMSAYDQTVRVALVTHLQ